MMGNKNNERTRLVGDDATNLSNKVRNYTVNLRSKVPKSWENSDNGCIENWNSCFLQTEIRVSPELQELLGVFRGPDFESQRY